MIANEKQTVWLMGLLPFIVGLISICGWIFGIDGLLTLIPNMPPIQAGSALLTVISGAIFLTFGKRDNPKVKIAHGIIGLLMLLFTVFLLASKYLGVEHLAFKLSQFVGLVGNPNFDFEIVPIVWYCWGAIGTIFILLSSKETMLTVIIGEALTMLVLFLAIVGFIMSTSRFDILYTWVNTFSMPAGMSLSFIAICIGLISIWSRTRRYQNYFTGFEDLKIISFSGALLIQSAIIAGLICFTTLAKQNEVFLKSSLEQNMNLKVNIFKNTLQGEIEEVDVFKKSKYLENALSGNSQAEQIQGIEDFFKSHRVDNWQLIKKDGAVIQGDGTLKPMPLSVINIPKRDDVVLFFDKKWALYFTLPIEGENKILGYLKFEYPLPTINNNFWTENGLPTSQEHLICKHEIHRNSIHCFSSLDAEVSHTLSTDSKDPLKSAAVAALTSTSKAIIYDNFNNTGTIALLKSVSEFELLIILKVNSEQIYNKIISQFKFSLPLLLWLIFFSLAMLSWQVKPLFRKVLASEKDAIDNARLLSENEARLRAIVDNIGEAILVVDELAKIESINITACSMFGQQQNEIVGLHLGKFIKLPAHNEELKSPTINDFITESEWQEVMAYSHQGHEFFADYHITEIRIRQKKIFIVIIRNITQQKLAAEKIKESERLFRSSFDHAPIGMALISTSKKILQVNQSLCKMLGHNEQEILELKLLNIIAPKINNNLQAIDDVFNDTSRYLEQENFLINKTGQLVAVKINLSVMTDANDIPLYIIVQAQDITERHRIESELKTANEQLITRYKELEQNNSETALAAEMSSILQSCLTTSEALEPIQKYAGKIFKNTSGIIYLVIPGAPQMIPQLYWGDPLAKNELLLTNDCWGLRRGQPYVIKDVKSEICCKHTQQHLRNNESYLCIPLLAQGELIGSLYIEPNPIEEDSKIEKLSKIMRRAVSFADQISLALANINLRESLQHQSTHDALTGLYNRRFLDESLKLEILKSNRKSSPLSLLMIDVDHFKTFNDKHGHDVGDTVLQEISKTIGQSIRKSDIACRMGGEEFLVILPETSLEIAIERGEEIRAAATNLCINYGNKSIENITVSVGIASYPDHGQTAQELLEAVDKALYLSKNNGRNRVSIVAA